MYIFNKITVNPQLPKKIEKLSEISGNLWWSWNTEFLKLFKKIDIDLWEKIGKNPVKFLKLVDQERLEAIAEDSEFLKEYNKNVENFEGYMNSKNTWFNKTYPENKNDLIAYFSAEYGLDEILPIYSGGLGILSGDHLKSSSDLGLPLVAVGLLYKNGYFHQKINSIGMQESEYYDIELDNLPITPVKRETGEDLIISVKMPNSKLYLKVWKIAVGRINLYLLDSDIEENSEEYRGITLRLYGGDQEMRIQQEIVLGIGGVTLLQELGLAPTVYHMNEGHSSFLVLELIKNIMAEKEVSFNIARDIVTAKTVFTTHTPVPAGNDIFPVELVERYFNDYWKKLGLSKEEFMELGMKPKEENKITFNMGILALKVAGKKNGVSKLHGAVSRELFGDVWPEITPNESPITYVTNGIHTCTWLAPTLKELYNKYLTPFWQDKIHLNETWEKIGFNKGTVSKGINFQYNGQNLDTGNIKFLIHGLRYDDQLTKIDAFSDIDSTALLSTSYATRVEEKHNFYRPQGVILNASTKQIHGAYREDAGEKMYYGYIDEIKCAKENRRNLKKLIF